MYKYPSAAMSPSIWYWSLISGEKYYECILLYSVLDSVVSKKQYFSSQDINLAPRHVSETALLKIIFDSKRDSAVNDASSGYYGLSPPTVIITMYGSDFSGR